mmetsp:Transcript_34193/g.102141  ORF Transcript_34193/g.102141 Transcript_34193/m.102141 type:complete len:237 (+) Transcript_34193:171-881(+)
MWVLASRTARCGSGGGLRRRWRSPRRARTPRLHLSTSQPAKRSERESRRTAAGPTASPASLPTAKPLRASSPASGLVACGCGCGPTAARLTARRASRSPRSRRERRRRCAVLLRAARASLSEGRAPTRRCGRSRRARRCGARGICPTTSSTSRSPSGSPTSRLLRAGGSSRRATASWRADCAVRCGCTTRRRSASRWRAWSHPWARRPSPPSPSPRTDATSSPAASAATWRGSTLG